MREKYCNNCERVLSINKELQAEVEFYKSKRHPNLGGTFEDHYEIEKLKALIDQRDITIETLKTANLIVIADLEKAREALNGKS